MSRKTGLRVLAVVGLLIWPTIDRMAHGQQANSKLQEVENLYKLVDQYIDAYAKTSLEFYRIDLQGAKDRASAQEWLERVVSKEFEKIDLASIKERKELARRIYDDGKGKYVGALLLDDTSTVRFPDVRVDHKVLATNNGEGLKNFRQPSVTLYKDRQYNYAFPLDPKHAPKGDEKSQLVEKTEHPTHDFYSADDFVLHRLSFQLAKTALPNAVEHMTLEEKGDSLALELKNPVVGQPNPYVLQCMFNKATKTFREVRHIDCNEVLTERRRAFGYMPYANNKISLTFPQVVVLEKPTLGFAVILIAAAPPEFEKETKAETFILGKQHASLDRVLGLKYVECEDGGRWNDMIAPSRQDAGRLFRRLQDSDLAQIVGDGG